MQQIRIRRKALGSREDRRPVLPLDARDPDVVRAKALRRESSERGRSQTFD